MKILGTGLNGLVGSRIVELLGEKYEFENISRSVGIDIEDKDSVLRKIKSSDAQIVLHLAAKTDVDECEKDKALGKEGEAWKINVNGTKNIADGCLKSNKKLIYVSTDFVFDGENQPVQEYSEEDIPNPINWYAQTKYEGEKIVQSLKAPWTITRISYPYRAVFERLDFVRAILKRLKGRLPVSAVTDQIFTPTFIDDIAFAIDAMIKNDSRGIFHAVGAQSLTPYEAAIIIAETYGFDQEAIVRTTRAQFFKDRAPRPFQLALKNDKIRKLGIKMRGFKEGLREIKSQMSKFKSAS